MFSMPHIGLTAIQRQATLMLPARHPHISNSARVIAPRVSLAGGPRRARANFMPMDRAFCAMEREMDSFESQNEKVLAFMQLGNSIDPMLALKKFGVFRLGGSRHGRARALP